MLHHGSGHSRNKAGRALATSGKRLINQSSNLGVGNSSTLGIDSS